MELEYRINFEYLRENVIRNPNISSGAKAVLVDLLLYANVHNKSFPSQSTLAHNHGYSTRHIRNLLNELVTNELLTWELRPGTSNKYIFSEEIYFRSDTVRRKHNSSGSGNPLPEEFGNPVPTNIVTVNNSQVNDSHPADIQEKKLVFPCGRNGCEYGYIYNRDNNSSRECECLIKYKQRGGSGQ